MPATNSLCPLAPFAGPALRLFFRCFSDGPGRPLFNLCYSGQDEA